MKRISTLLATVALAVVVASSAIAADNSPFTVTSSGISTKGFFRVVQEALHNIWREAYPGTAATAKPGTIAGGMVQTANREADVVMAITPVELQHGTAGIAPFQAPLKGKLTAMLTLMDKLDFYFVARKEWADQLGIKNFGDIARVKPKANVALNRKGTFYINVAAEGIFKAYGFTTSDLEKWGGHINWVATGPGLADLKDGKADFMVGAGFQPDARVRDVTKARELIWLEVPDDILEKVAKSTDMVVTTLPGSFYSFFNGKPHKTLRANTLMGAGVHASEDAVYKMVKGLAENIDKIKAIHPTFKDFTVQTMVQKSDIIPWHPGAAKYYRERGLIK